MRFYIFVTLCGLTMILFSTLSLLDMIKTRKEMFHDTYERHRKIDSLQQEHEAKKYDSTLKAQLRLSIEQQLYTDSVSDHRFDSIFHTNIVEMKRQGVDPTQTMIKAIEQREDSFQKLKQ